MGKRSIERVARVGARVLLGGVAALPTLGVLIILARFLRNIVAMAFGVAYHKCYPYWIVTPILLGIAAVSVFCIYKAFRYRSYSGALFIVPILLGIFVAILAPNISPDVYSMMADSNCISNVRAYISVWSDAHHRYPLNEKEFVQAMQEGPAHWRSSETGWPLESEYAAGWSRLECQVVVVRNATGPQLKPLSPRPAVVYYNVSADGKHFWATLSGINDDDYASTADIAHVCGEAAMDVRMARGDYEDKSSLKP